MEKNWWRGDSTEEHVSHEQLIDLSPPTQLESRFIEQFHDETSQQSLHLQMAAGLIARETRQAYALNSEEQSMFGGCCLDHYSELLTSLVNIAEIAEGTSTDIHNRAALWGDYLDALVTTANSNNAAIQRKIAKIQSLHTIFAAQGREALVLSEIMQLVNFTHSLRTAPELVVCKRLEAHDFQALLRNTEHLDKDVIKAYSYIDYWEANKGFSALPDRDRYGDADKMMTTLNMKDLNKKLNSNWHS